MSYIFKGTLCGRLCDDCEEDLSNVQVKLYRLQKDQRETVLATANPKNTFVILSEEEVEAKEDYLLAETETDEKGRFEFELGDNQDYEGEAFEIDVYVERAPGQEELPDDTEPIQFTITTLQPQWRETKEGLTAVWKYCIPYRFWCRIREILGAYVICGQVLNCEKQIPLPGVRVLAFDRDWWQDDPLGSTLTDSTGHFKIYYSANDFKQGTFIDVELFGGPDLYFHVETTSGSPLLIEDPSKGRDADRENSGACFCVTLCSEDPQIDENPKVSVFTNIGGYNYETDIDSLPSGTGLTVGSNRAFYSTIRLNGVLAKTLNGNPVEYRFEYQELNSSGSPISGWQKVSSGQIAKTKIGKLERANDDYPGSSLNPIETVKYVVGTATGDEMEATIISDGHGDWIQVPQESSSADSSTGFFDPNGNMIRLQTQTLAPFSDIDLSGLETGSSSTSTGQPLAQNRYFAIRMLIREGGDTGSGNPAGTCQRVAINNVRYDNIDSHPDWSSDPNSNQLAVAMVDIDQLSGPGAGCSEINDALDVLFTAAHPTLGTVSITMEGPGDPYSFILPAPVTPGDHFGTANPDFTVSDLTPCAYIVTLSVQVLLTTGDSTPDDLTDQIAFCKA